MRTRFLPALLLSSVLTAQSQYQWTPLNFATRPFARQRLAMVYDAGRSQTVLFGGFNGGYMNDTWTLDLGGWQRRLPAVSPPARADHAMAYDPVRQRVVVLGGSNGSPLSDIWEWDGTTWAQRAASVPGLSDLGAACYDPTQEGVFYNKNGFNLLWDGTTAHTIVVASPDGAQEHQMVYDAASRSVLTAVNSNTLLFRQPGGWTHLMFVNPFGRIRYALAIDPRHNHPVLHGGDNSGGSFSFSDTWRWDGANWWLMTGQDSRSRHGMVFDLQRGALVAFGGLRGQGNHVDTTVVLTETRMPAEYVQFGSGCQGTAARAPALAPDLLWNSAPILGGLFFLRLDGLPASQPVLGLVGSSDQSFSGVPLPLDLGAAGMPGCHLRVAPDLLSFLGAASSSGVASWPLPIPADSRLLGAVFFQQGAVVAPGANAAGVLWSNGGRGTIGLR